MKIIRSRRKTLCIEITKDLQVVVRAPLFCSDNKTKQFILSHEAWISEKLSTAKRNAKPPLTSEEIEHLREKAKREIPPLVEHYGKIMGVKPTAVKITSAKTRFGSCSAKNSLCFSLYLMRYPKKFIEYVVVHELAHTVHHNHSKSFYELVSKYMPDYKERLKLSKNGGN